MLVNVILSGEVCHCLVPVLPAKVMVVVLPLQIGLGEAEAVPPTEVGFTVTVAIVELVVAHTPLVTSAL